MFIKEWVYIKLVRPENLFQGRLEIDSGGVWEFGLRGLCARFSA